MKQVCTPSVQNPSSPTPEQFVRRLRIGKVCAHNWKAIRRLKESLKMLGGEVPLNRILHLTLTCYSGTSDFDVTKEFSAITRNLRELFPGGWVRVLSYTRARVPHIHAIVVAAEDVRSDFNSDGYKEMRELDERPGSLDGEARRRRNYLRRHLTSNAHLISLTSKVKEVLRRRSEQHKKEGSRSIFAPRFELAPILKNMKAMAVYLGKNIEAAAKNVTTRSKGVRLIAYSRNFPKFPMYALPASRRSLEWHERMRWVISGLKMPPDYMTERFGPRWAFYITQYVFNPLEKEYGRDLQNWPNFRELGRRAMKVLSSQDRWSRSGWPKEAVEWMRLYDNGPVDCMQFVGPIPEYFVGTRSEAAG